MIIKSRVFRATSVSIYVTKAATISHLPFLQLPVYRLYSLSIAVRLVELTGVSPYKLLAAVPTQPLIGVVHKLNKQKKKVIKKKYRKKTKDKIFKN